MTLTKREKIEIVAEYFVKHGGSMIEVSEALKKENINISKSSVQRYLNEKNQIIQSFNEETFKKIQDRLKQQKADGVKRGGINFALNNDYIKDKVGYFDGSKPKTR